MLLSMDTTKPARSYWAQISFCRQRETREVVFHCIWLHGMGILTPLSCCWKRIRT
ncbi:hypothetical protein ANCCAN_11885 [Ancylostoma caninum]|uniref:Uncharacterized protein n=1 Tax=Ancylostoma caninum TaxID=29170 RepID=A0A368GCL4_ANCCA|nr:hypothetical protein ANCCAN_11885 [Ancylostoma caninum]